MLITPHIIHHCPSYTYHAAVCVVCFKKITEFKLQKCSGCKLVFYCSKEHQKSHWPIHKELCKPIQLMIKNIGKVGLFDENVDKGFALGWLLYRKTLIWECEALIKRMLNQNEVMIFLNPFVCNICHIYKSNRMITCKDCCGGYYCSEEHQLKNKSNHSLLCSVLKFSLDFDTNLNQALSAISSISDVSTLPSDMKTFIDKYVGMKTVPPVGDLFVGCYLSEFLTLPLTLIYVIEKSNIDLTKKSIRVHVVGSSVFESEASWYWEYIFHYFKNLKVMHFVFVGPDNNIIELSPLILRCQDCINSRSLSFVYENDLYHNYVKRVTESPDIILAYNCGFKRWQNVSHLDTWKDSMPALCSFPGVVVAFTSFDEDESKEDLKELKEFSKNDNLTVLVECQKNPFRSLKPKINYEELDIVVCYSNNFISIIRT